MIVNVVGVLRDSLGLLDDSLSSNKLNDWASDSLLTWFEGCDFERSYFLKKSTTEWLSKWI